MIDSAGPELFVSSVQLPVKGKNIHMICASLCHIVMSQLPLPVLKTVKNRFIM